MPTKTLTLLDKALEHSATWKAVFVANALPVVYGVIQLGFWLGEKIV